MSLFLFEKLSLARVLAWCFAAFVLHRIYRCVYNLYFHPLSKFPGPRLAAATSLYEFWFDVIRDGLYIWEVEKMHDKYGPIVRVNPRELHIRDSSYYNMIYTLTDHEVQKDIGQVDGLAFPGSLVTTVDHHLHRVRRGYLNPYFSKRSLHALETTVRERIGRLCQRLESLAATDEVVILDRAFGAMTADIITKYLYGEHYDYLGSPGFFVALTEMFYEITGGANLARFLPSTAILLRKLPISILRRFSPGAATLLTHQQDIHRRMAALMADENARKANSGMLTSLLDDDIPAEEKGVTRILNEGIVILIAGTETTARSISVGLFYLLQDKEHIRKLREEIGAIRTSDETPPLSELERLPYLRAVVRESLRLSFGAVLRLPRIAPNKVLKYGDYDIPQGTPLSQSAYFVNTDPALFPDPMVFDPSRWIKAQESGVNLESYLANFTKGTRGCLGIQLAYAEMYLALASIICKFDMELYETSVEHVQCRRVRLLGYPDPDPRSVNSRGQVMVKITGTV
ncbi:uncharacterized protein UV8b_04626 [Ustilaginoidea virens]|uniref:Uncharacterized protein n=1 Tax=Ustilaginoidea virens TaxID=1159556 RepID=A0A063C6I8_USTVR|nr:uncharacterized protein UV8b_04626 [Ustilaginoidea virens]QUC20385.1 hypothetical protein UV8b_04626 [Ustilaginoidea virens]GAO14689.1 hypothetical protein UVI_02028960 [Ustilaginoidea virens]